MTSRLVTVRAIEGKVCVDACDLRLSLPPEQAMVFAAAVARTARQIVPDVPEATPEQLRETILTAQQAALIDAVPEGRS